MRQHRPNGPVFAGLRARVRLSQRRLRARLDVRVGVQEMSRHERRLELTKVSDHGKANVCEAFFD